MEYPNKLLIDGSKFGVDKLQISWYGALIVLGIIISYILLSIEAKRRRLHKDCVVDLCLWCIPLGAIFARLYYIVFSLNEFIKPDLSFGQVLLGMLNVRSGGLAIYGAIIGGMLGMFIYSRRKKMHFLSITDLVLPGVAISQAIGRWGNFFNQEAYGGVISKSFPPYFPLAVKIRECTQPCCENLSTNLGNLHYATFFYESCWCFVIFIVLWFILRKRVKHRGDITLAYIIMYGVERSLVESLRTDSLMLGSVRVSQALSIILVVVAVALIIIRAVAEKKKGRTVMPVEENYYAALPAEEPKKKDDGWAVDEAAEEAAEEAEEAVEETAEEAAEEAAETVEETAEEAKEAAEDAAETVEKAAEAVEEAVEKAEE